MRDVKNCLTCRHCHYVQEDAEFVCISKKSIWSGEWVDYNMRCEDWEKYEEDMFNL